MRAALLLATGLLAAAGAQLSGCAAAPTAPGVVKVAVAEPCRTELPPRPALPFDTVALDADIWTIGTALYAERKIREAYELALVTRLKGCIDGGPQP